MVGEISVLARVMSTTVLPREHGRAVRGWLYHVINAGDPELAEELHRQGGDHQDDDRGPANHKPFTCSELLDTEVRPDGLLSLEAGQAVRLRLTTLTAEVLLALDAGFAASGPDITLAVRDFDSGRDRVAELRIVDLSMPRRLSYAELCELPGSKLWRLSFLSRTAFSSAAGDEPPSGGKREGVHWLLPIPRLMLANLIAKWNHFAADRDAGPPIDEREFGRALHPHLVVSRVQDLWTEPGAESDFRKRGFRGAIELQVLEDLPRSLFRQFTALLNFAPFGGIGARTTEGWGQVAVERLRP